jgi:hypothetical protein
MRKTYDGCLIVFIILFVVIAIFIGGKRITTASPKDTMQVELNNRLPEYYNNPDNFKSRPDPYQIPQRVNGPYIDQLGNTVLIDWQLVENRKSDGFGELFTYRGNQYYINQTGKLFLLR